MRRQARQLPVEDPLGFPDQQAFAARVREALGQDPRYPSLPLNDFNPIRSGAMKACQLRLVDTFGQVQVLNPSDVSVSEPLAGPGQDRLAWLPPSTGPARPTGFPLAGGGCGFGRDEFTPRHDPGLRLDRAQQPGRQSGGLRRPESSEAEAFAIDPPTKIPGYLLRAAPPLRGETASLIHICNR